MTEIKEDVRKAIAELTLMDDIFMSKVFENDTQITELVLRIILKNDKIKVIKASSQKKIKNLLGHDLTLDVLAELPSGERINVEIQNQSSGANERRARYHLSMLDAGSLPKGTAFKDMADNYVIFITQHDVLKGGLPIYHIHRVIDENSAAFVDGSHIIYVNNKIKDDTPLGRLMHDFSCQSPQEMYYPQLAQKSRQFKEMEEGVGTMGDVFERFAEAREKAAAEKAKAELRKEMGHTFEKLAEVREKAAAEKALRQNTLDIAQNMLINGMSVELTAKSTKLTLDEVRTLAAKVSA